MAGGRLWTTLEDKELMDMVKRGIKYSVIAKRLNRSYGAVHGRLSRQRSEKGIEPLPRLHKPGELAEKVRTLCIPGVPDSVVGEILGITRSAIRGARKRGDIPSGCRQHAKIASPERANITLCAKIIRLYGSNKGIGISDAAIGAKLGITRQCVAWYRRKSRLPALGMGSEDLIED